MPCSARRAAFITSGVLLASRCGAHDAAAHLHLSDGTALPLMLSAVGALAVGFALWTAHRLKASRSIGG